MQLSITIWQRRRWVLLSVSVALVLLSAACGGKSDPQPTATPAGPGSRGNLGAFGNLDRDALSACMQAAGFESDAAKGAAGFGGFGGPGANADPERAAALRSCMAAQGVSFPDGTPPAGGFTRGGFRGSGPRNLDIASVVQCLQDAGIDVGDAGDTGDLRSLLGALDRTNATVQAALQSCLGPIGSGNGGQGQ